MKITFLAIILLSGVCAKDAKAATWKKLTGGAEVIACPPGYIYVAPIAPYTTRNFCVMKYEAKKDAAGMPESVAAGVPWSSMTRNNAQTHCRALGHGYDLISNDEWQTLARAIAATASNWSSGIVASLQLSRGHSDGSPGSALAASNDDNDACYLTEQTCSSALWNDQRRTNELPNGKVIWDLGGNVAEWINTDSNVSYGTNSYMSAHSSGAVQLRFGAATATMCSSPSSNNYCGMGYGTISSAAGAIIRGGGYGSPSGGIFSTTLTSGVSTSGPYGFRCTFTP